VFMIEKLSKHASSDIGRA